MDKEKDFALGESFYACIRVKFGNGVRLAYDAASSTNCKLNEFLTEDGWQFPRPAPSYLIRGVQDLPQFDVSDSDQVEWLQSANKKFSTTMKREVAGR